MQKIRFLLGGAVGVGLYYLTLYLLTEKLGVWYVVSAIVGFVVNTSANFVIQKFWTFEDRRRAETPDQILKYFALMTGILVANACLLYILVEYGHLRYIVAQIPLTCVLTVVSYFFTRRIFSAS